MALTRRDVSDLTLLEEATAATVISTNRSELISIDCFICATPMDAETTIATRVNISTG